MTNSAFKYKSNFERDVLALALDNTAKMPLQSQLLDALRRIITSNPDHSGARLPASRTLAADLSVSRTTVQAVYDQLISEGYLITRQGSGTFVAEDVPHLTPAVTDTATRPVRSPAEAWTPFQTGLPDQSLLPNKIFARHLERAWSRPDPALFARLDPLGWGPLREAIADHLRAWRQVSCDAEQVVITAGASDSLDVVFRGLVEPGLDVAIEDPCWPKIHDVLAKTGARAHPMRVDDEGFDAAHIPPQARAAIVTPSRHYPTGHSLPMPRRMALLDWAERSGGLVIEDDYDSEFRYRGQPLPALSGVDELRNTIYLGSFSKLFGPALRIGFLVLPRPLLGNARRYLADAGTRVSLVPQPALAAFMGSGEFAVHLRRMRRIYARRQAHLIQCLAPLTPYLTIEPDPSGMHLCLPFKPSLARHTRDRTICAMAKKQGLEIGALSAHCTLADAPQGLLLGYAAFEEPVLTRAADTLIDIVEAEVNSDDASRLAV
ncbi:MAG: PLP-dependent aminotransferase family protein [Pseudomonadota bacterium]